MKTLNVSKSQMYLLDIIERMGPEKDEYAFLNSFLNKIKEKKEAMLFREFFKPVLNEHTLCGYTYLKPLGYAGDYKLIEMIYKKHISELYYYSKWDRFYHSQEATKAVLNRKKFFVSTLEQIYAEKKKPLKVLILGCGPASDVHEFYLKNPFANVSFDLLDIDQRAIDYATDKNVASLNKINFLKMNVLRFSTTKKYDLIWSAGLFDYLNDKYFTNLLKRFKDNLEKDGEMIIGNFSTNNPSRIGMEVMCEWFLIHRDENQLLQFGREAGIPQFCMEVDKEPLGINLFLRIKPMLNQYAFNPSLNHIETAESGQLSHVI